MARATAETSITGVTLELQPEEAEQLAALVAFVRDPTPELAAIHRHLSVAYPSVRSNWALKADRCYVEPTLVRYPEDSDA